VPPSVDAIDQPEAIDQPATIDKPRRTTVAGLAAFVAGPDSGPTALFLPGYTGSKEDFVPVLPLLAAAGVRAVAVDQRGQYESQGDPDGPDSQYALDALADDVAAVAKELGCRVHLVGHSFGGLVARVALLNHPEVLTSVTLLGSGPAAIGGSRRLGLLASYAIYARGGIQAVWDGIRTMDPAEHPPEHLRFLHRRFFASSERAMLTMGQILLDEPDRVAEAAAAAVAHDIPLLVTHGVDDDAWFAPQQADMAARLGARYVVIGDAMHSPATQNPSGTADVLVPFFDEAEAEAAA
jgi:pimeloyl-ACP methyl ester carboxylesterase